MIPNYATEVYQALDRELPGQNAELLRLYSLLVLTEGVNTTLEHVHDAWALWRMFTRPEHVALVPFDQLTPEVQALDQEFVDAIHKVARELHH